MEREKMQNVGQSTDMESSVNLSNTKKKNYRNMHSLGSGTNEKRAILKTNNLSKISKMEYFKTAFSYYPNVDTTAIMDTTLQ